MKILNFRPPVPVRTGTTASPTESFWPGSDGQNSSFLTPHTLNNLTNKKSCGLLAASTVKDFHPYPELTGTKNIFTTFNKKQTTMLTLNTILKDMKDVPVNRLEELYQFVHSLTPKNKQKENIRKKILSFAGIFSDMTDKDYSDFVNQTKKTRTKFFDRNIEL